ncbi:MAG: hypothetical protein KDA96_20175 [Planctomycetaceae bacterium]|nr:hypothetical protein [Planctomycetaceae bacterium]
MQIIEREQPSARLRVMAGLLCIPLVLTTAAADEISDAVDVLRSSEVAAQSREALQSLQKHDTAALIPVLKGFQGATPVASNWLQNAFESIADAHIADRSLPRAELLAFISDTSESPAARRLAYEWLLQTDASLEEQLIPGMLLDPGSEFRRDAVARLISQAKGAGEGADATAIYRKAMAGAVHEDQVKTISAALRKAGEDVNIQKHFGFLTTWQIIGPFDNRDEQGFAVEYPPESAINLKAEYPSEYPNAGSVKWLPVSTDDDFGIVDIAEKIHNHKGSLMYATTTYTTDSEKDVEIRLGTPNAWKLWVNGQLVFAREEYHRSTRMDQYRIPVHLKAGVNVVTIKVCQNEQKDDWAQAYRFQLRVCDSTGAGIPTATASAERPTSATGVK